MNKKTSIQFYWNSNKFLKNYQNNIISIFNKVLSILGLNDEAIVISVNFVDDDTAISLNKVYRNKFYLPDVLSFSNYDNFVKLYLVNKVDKIKNMEIDLGDIFISTTKCISQALDYEHSLLREVSFLFLHGLLHLLGYDHIQPEDENIMFSLQSKVLNALNIKRVNKMNETNFKKYYKKCLTLKENSYSPYSKFQVSAIVVTDTGKEYYGVNVENAAYGDSICAERNALTQAYTMGVRKPAIKFLFLFTNSKQKGTPCGSCRQVMSELMPLSAEVVISNSLGSHWTETVESLLPNSFSSNELNS